MELPSISIVTPTRNQAPFIRATLDSVLAQGYPDLDYRVLDGGSTDGTQAILSSYGPGLSWASAPDRGQTDAINRGWRAARGEILAWINSDDLYLPGALLRVGEFFAAHPKIDLLYGDCLYIDEKGAGLGSYPARPYDYRRLVVETENFIPQPAAFLRRKVFEDCGDLDESLGYVMDLDYWLRAGLRHPAAYLPEKLAALRLHKSAKSVEQLGRFAGELVRVYQKYFAQSGLPPDLLREQARAMGNACHYAADCAFWAGQLPQARAYALRSALYRPLRPRRLWLYLALGSFGRRLAARRHANPYFPESAAP